MSSKDLVSGEVPEFLVTENHLLSDRHLHTKLRTESEAKIKYEIYMG